MSAHTPGPWDYVEGTEHHGPYVTTQFGTTVCDCYAMSNPLSLSVRNGGDSRPINHMAEMAGPNARLIAAAPELLAALKQWAEIIDDMVARGHIIAGIPDASTGYFVGTGNFKLIQDAIAKAEGRS